MFKLRRHGSAPAGLVVALAVFTFAPPSPADPTNVASDSTPLDFETFNQSMWGPNGPSVIDTGKLFVGPEWGPASKTVNASLQFGLDIGPVTLGSTSETDVDLTVSTAGGKVGFDFQAILDPGSVDASYSSNASIQILDNGLDGVGKRHLIIQSSESGTPDAGLVTRSPQIDIESNFITQVETSFGIDGKIITQPAFSEFPNPCGGRFQLPCIFNGQSEQSVDVDTTVQVLNIDDSDQILKFTNTELTIAGINLIGAEPDSGQIEVEFNIGFDAAEFVAGMNPFDVKVIPAGAPKNPRPGQNADPTDLGGVSFSVGDITLYVPLLNTEGDQFDGALNGVAAVTTEGQTNLARVDVDADFLASVYAALPPLGVDVSIGPSAFRFGFGADILDADVGGLFLGDQQFAFAPELMQTLQFNEEVEYRIGSTGAFQLGDTIVSKVGEFIEILANPLSLIDVTPVYHLVNQFMNQTRLLLQPVFEADLLKFTVDAPTPIPDPPGAVVKNFQQNLGPPITLPDLFNETFALGGFDAVPGATLSLEPAIDAMARLETGSPAQIGQQVPTPIMPFFLEFDYLFQTGGGTLEVLLDGLVFLTLLGPGAAQSEFQTFAGSFDLAGTFIDPFLTFVFDGDPGEVLLLDDILFPGLVNGNFQSGDLSGWLVETSGAASVDTILRLTSVPEPGTMLLLLLGMLCIGLIAGRARMRA